MKIILKYRNRSRILTIREVCRERPYKPTSRFSFSEACKEAIVKYILNLDTSKTCQDTNVPIGAIKENTDIFAEFLGSSKL